MDRNLDQRTVDRRAIAPAGTSLVEGRDDAPGARDLRGLRRECTIDRCRVRRRHQALPAVAQALCIARIARGAAGIAERVRAVDGFHPGGGAFDEEARASVRQLLAAATA